MSDSGEGGGVVGCTFECEASKVDWEVLDASITEELNEPYQISLSLRTTESHEHAYEMLGKPCFVTFHRGSTTSKYPAVLYRLEDTVQGGLPTQVSLRASAALWMLSQNRQTRIFQNKTVPEILDEVLKAGLNAHDRTYEAELTRDYPKCEYRVQYDESDLAFCQRLMEEEGIVCRFDHQEDAQAEVLLLTDDTTTSRDAAQPVDFSGDRVSNDCIQNISRGSLVRPTKLAMRNFNWTAPSVVIEAEQGEAKSPLVETYHHDRLPPTLYDYTDGDGYQGNDANAQSQLRRELDASGELVLNGYGDVIGLSAGGRFELKEHVLAGEYLLTMVNHSFSIDDVTAYTTSFTCIPVSTPYRPQRRTPKPRVPGLETATVVGPSGQEIHADKHGRIKVQFHWDREGENDDHSSCFIRVVQPWAGAGWGFVFLPRIGMEVTVAFIQGDPDRPIITGTLYNGENLTPYEMPDEMTKSTIRTQSSPGGDGYNELSFEDKAGEEEVFLQAQRNLRELVKNDHGTRVENDQTLDVIGNQTTTIGEDEPRDATQTITVYGDKIEDVTGNFDETIIEGNFTQTVSKGDFDQTLDEGHFTQTISKGDFTHIVSEGGFSCTVGGEWKTEANKKVTLKSAEENVEVASAKKMDLKAGGDFKLKGDAKGEIELTDELKIKVGSASITITSSGDIELKGANIKINGDGEVTIKGSKTAIN